MPMFRSRMTRGPREGHSPVQAVFLHTGWRTAGTWIWGRFRNLEGVRGFYEPFHAVLGCSRETIASATPDAWASGHDGLGSPYFEEYLDLLHKERRVEGYSRAFEVDRFTPIPWWRNLGQRSYVRGLIAHSKGAGQVAVLKFCRSMGRLPGLLRDFPGAAHFVVLRNPASQWSSYWSQWKRHGNPWFMTAPYRVLGQNLSASERTRRVVRALGLDESLLAHIAALPEAAAMVAAQEMPVEVSYRAHLAHWTLCQLSLDARLDGILDSDLLSTSASYREECSASFSRVTGLNPTFGDARHSENESFLQFGETGATAPAFDGMTLDQVLSLHLAADRFASQELGSAEEKFALKIIRSKLQHANQIVSGGDGQFDSVVGDSYSRP